MRSPTWSVGPGLALPRRLPPGLGRRKLQPIKVEPGSGLDVHEIGDLDLQCAGDGEERVEGRVPPRSLDFREIPERQPDPVSGIGLSPP